MKKRRKNIRRPKKHRKPGATVYEQIKSRSKPEQLDKEAGNRLGFGVLAGFLLLIWWALPTENTPWHPDELTQVRGVLAREPEYDNPRKGLPSYELYLVEHPGIRFWSDGLGTAILRGRGIDSQVSSGTRISLSIPVADTSKLTSRSSISFYELSDENDYAYLSLFAYNSAVRAQQHSLWRWGLKIILFILLFRGLVVVWDHWGLLRRQVVAYFG